VDKQERVGDEDENDMEDTSGPEKAGVRLARWGLADPYRCNYPTDWDLHLPYRGWLKDSHTKFS
jgi:hypothetical protein